VSCRQGSLSPAVVVPLHETGLEVVRALGRRGVYVIGVDEDAHRPGAHSRYCRRVVRSAIEGEALAATLQAIGESLGTKAALFPCGDPQVLSVSEHRDALERHYFFNLPDAEVVATLMHKDRFADFATRHGYPVPQTLVVRSLEEAQQAARVIRYPCIVKPAVRGVAWEARRMPKNYMVHSPEALCAAYAEFHALASQAVVQEWIPGSDEEVLFCLLCIDSQGRPLATFTGRKLRQWPPERGCTAIATGHQAGELEELTLRFMNEVGFRGLGSMEYRRDTRDGRLVMIEPTVGRIDLQSGVSELYGVSLPWVAYADMVGIRISPRPPGVSAGEARWVHEEGVARLWLRQVRRGRIAFREWGRLLRGRKRFAVFAGDDLAPTAALVCEVARKTWRALSGWFVHLRRSEGE
jgi:predicted ATP-grasp superfamily ATP-dependent carboligase